jgi:hypothetical protein
MLLGVLSLPYWTYTSLLARPEFSRWVDDSKVYVDPAWVEYWLAKRDQKRMEAALEKSIVEDAPEVAADKILEWARVSTQAKILEELKLLQPVLSEETVKEFA